MTPDERIRLARNQNWLAENQSELEEHYGKALHQTLTELGLYALEDGVHLQMTLANGLTLDFLVPVDNPGPVLQQREIKGGA